MSLIKYNNVSKIYKNKIVLNNLSLDLEKGKCLAILGPNGAGKTTLIRMTLGVIPTSKGLIEFYGMTMNNSRFNLKRKIGVVLEDLNFFLDITGIEYLKFICELYKTEDVNNKINYYLDYMGLKDSGNKKIKNYSTGMKKKLNVIQAVIHEPELLIMDELYSGLDPIGIELVFNLLIKLKSKGVTIIISSHILSNLDLLVDDLLILDKGIIKSQGEKKSLFLNYSLSPVIKLELLDKSIDIDSLLLKVGILKNSYSFENNIYYIPILQHNNLHKDISTILAKNNICIFSLSIEQPTVKKLYSEIMNNKENY